MSISIEQDNRRLENEELRMSSQKLFTEAMRALELFGRDKGVWPFKYRALNGSLQKSDNLTPEVSIIIKTGVDTKNAKQVRLKLDDREGAIFIKRGPKKPIRVEEEVYVQGDYYRKPADLDTVELYRDVIRVIWPLSNRGKGK